MLKVLVNLTENSWKSQRDLNGTTIGSDETKINEWRGKKFLNSRILSKIITENWLSYQLCLEQFRLPPLKNKKGFVPYLQVKCDLSGSSCSLSLRVELYHLEKNKMKAIGIRFETGDIAHNFCHVQLFSLRSFSQKIPDEDPCIPTAAACPISLLICLIISLYGLKTWNRYFTDISLEKRHKDAMKQFFC